MTIQSFLVSTYVSTYTMAMAALALVLLLLLLLLRRVQQHVQQIAHSLTWQQEKMERADAGWRPALWDEDDPSVTEDEKIEALLAYVESRAIPPCGRQARMREQMQGDRKEEIHGQHHGL